MVDYRKVVADIERLESTWHGKIRLWLIRHSPFWVLDILDYIHPFNHGED